MYISDINRIYIMHINRIQHIHPAHQQNLIHTSFTTTKINTYIMHIKRSQHIHHEHQQDLTYTSLTSTEFSSCTSKEFNASIFLLKKLQHIHLWHQQTSTHASLTSTNINTYIFHITNGAKRVTSSSTSSESDYETEVIPRTAGCHDRNRFVKHTGGNITRNTDTSAGSQVYTMLTHVRCSNNIFLLSKSWEAWSLYLT